MAARKTQAQQLESLREKLAEAEAKQAKKNAEASTKLSVDIFRLDWQIKKANEAHAVKLGELTKSHEDKVAKLGERRKAAYDELLAMGGELKEPTPAEVKAHTPVAKPKTEKPKAEQPKPTESEATTGKTELSAEPANSDKPQANATAVIGKGR